MGSGNKNLYSGTGGGSQPYSEQYSVYEEMLYLDKKDADIYGKNGYFKNPTAINLYDAISGNRILFEGKRQEGQYTYVLDLDGNLIFGKRCNPNDSRKRSPHPTLIGGKNPKVQCAGIIVFHKGKIQSINNQSGHYRPDIKSLEKVNDYMQALYNKNPELFDKESKWRKK